MKNLRGAFGVTLIEFVIMLLILGICFYSAAQATVSILAVSFLIACLFLLWFGFHALINAFRRLAHNWRLSQIKNSLDR